MKTTLALIGSLVLCIASVMIPAAPVSAAAATIVVTPGTGLVDEQVVTIAGQGFAPSLTVFFCQGRNVATPATTDCNPNFGTATTDSGGNFSRTFAVSRFINTVSTGTIDCAQPGTPCAILGTDDINGAGNVAVTPITFTQQPPLTYSIHGTVTNGNTQQPLAGIHVWVYTPSDGYVGSLRTTTGADGSYAIANPLPGVPYKMLFISTDPSLASTWHANANNRSSANPVVVWPGSVDSANPDIDAILFTPGSVSGTVTDPSGQPVVGMWVGLYFAGDTYVPTYIVTTGAGGTFTVGVKQGSYRVLFRPPSGSGLAPEWFNGSRLRSGATDVGVDSGTQVTGINAQLAPGS